MYRKCDNCIGVFKIPKIMLKRFNENENIIIYCPYCNSTLHHQTTEYIQSERGYIK